MLNKNAVSAIIENYFWDELEEEISDNVLDLECEDIENDFDMAVDFVELDSVDTLRIMEVETEEDEEDELISGALEVSVSIEGYHYFDGDSHPVGNAVKIMGFDFEFHTDGKDYWDFDLTYEY